MKNPLLAFSALVMIILSACLPLAASGIRKGSTVEVTMADGSKVRGELLAVKSDALWIYDHDAGRGEDLDLLQVVQVKVLKKNRVLQGLAMGMGAGIILSILIPHDHDMDDYGITTHFYRPIMISCLGGIIGNQASIPKRFSLAGVSSMVLKERLEQLKRFARDRDL